MLVMGVYSGECVGTPFTRARLLVLTAHCNRIYCKWENKARQDGKREKNLEKYQELWSSGRTRAPIGEK